MSTATEQNINSSFVLDDENNYTVNGSGQRLLTSAGLKARKDELKQLYPNIDIINFPDRDKEKVTDGIYITNTSGYAKLCPSCSNPHLSFNPLDNGGEFSCIECDKTWNVGSRVANVLGEKKTRNTTGTRKSSGGRIALDPTFIHPDTRNDKASEAFNLTKYQYAMQQMISLLDNLGINIASKECTEFIKDARQYHQEYKSRAEKRAAIDEELRKLDTQVNSVDTLLKTLGEDDVSYTSVKDLLERKIAEREKLRIEKISLT